MQKNRSWHSPTSTDTRDEHPKLIQPTKLLTSPSLSEKKHCEVKQKYAAVNRESILGQEHRETPIKKILPWTIENYITQASDEI